MGMALGSFLCKIFGKDFAAVAEPGDVWNGEFAQAFFYDFAQDSSRDARDMSDSLGVVIGEFFGSPSQPNPNLPEYEVLQCCPAGDFNVVSVRNPLVCLG